MANTNIKSKKVVEDKVEVKVEASPEPVEVPVKKIAPLTQDFGREDINQIRDKINEIINAQ